MILDNRRITIRKVADAVGISFGSCQASVLRMKCAAAKIVPKLLNLEQKQSRMDIVQEILIAFNDNPNLLKKVITGYESWLYGYDIAIKAKLLYWKRPEKPRSKKHVKFVQMRRISYCFLRL